MIPLKLTRWQRLRLQRQLQDTSDARVYRRTLAVLEASRGQSVVQIAQSLNVTRQSVYNWIASYAEACDPEVLIDADRSGRPSFWTEELRGLLRWLFAQSPDQLGYFAVNWTVPLLQEQLEHQTGYWLAEDTIRRELDRLGYVWKRSRYILDPDPQREKKTAAASGDPRNPGN
jgi:transposase